MAKKDLLTRIPSPNQSTKIQIGRFSFFRTQYHTLWLENEDGEGMEISEKNILDLEDLIQYFWIENF